MPPLKAALPSVGDAWDARMPATRRQGRRPQGETNGAYRTGRYTAEAKEERREQRALIRELRRLINAGD